MRYLRSDDDRLYLNLLTWQYRGKIRWAQELEINKMLQQETLRSPELVEYIQLCKDTSDAAAVANPFNPAEMIYCGNFTELTDRALVIAHSDSIYEQVVESASFVKEGKTLKGDLHGFYMAFQFKPRCIRNSYFCASHLCTCASKCFRDLYCSSAGAEKKPLSFLGNSHYFEIKFHLNFSFFGKAELQTYPIVTLFRFESFCLFWRQWNPPLVTGEVRPNSDAAIFSGTKTFHCSCSFRRQKWHFSSNVQLSHFF